MTHPSGFRLLGFLWGGTGFALAVAWWALSGMTGAEMNRTIRQFAMTSHERTLARQVAVILGERPQAPRIDHAPGTVWRAALPPLPAAPERDTLAIVPRTATPVPIAVRAGNYPPGAASVAPTVAERPLLPPPKRLG